MSDSADRATLKRKLKQQFGLQTDIAILGDGAGRIYYNARPGYVFVRVEQSISETGSPLYTAPFPVRHHPNANYKVADGTRVQLFIDRDGELAIEGADFLGMVGAGGNPAVLNPSNPYTKLIHPDRLTPLRSYAIATSTSATLKVAVESFAYITEGSTFTFFAGAQYDFTADVPATAGKKVLALLYLQDNALGCVVGSEKDSVLAFAPADMSEVVALMPMTAIPIALWVLTHGMTTITEKHLFVDLRQWMNIPNGNTLETFPLVVTTPITIPAGRQKVVGRTTIEAGGALIVHGRVRVV